MRLVHPFPSLLDGMVVALVAFVASGDGKAALLLGASMTLLQFAIGVVNDLVDRERDAGRTPPKPIPSGIVPVAVAQGLAVLAAGGGIALAAIAGPGVVALAVVGLAIGLAYDLRAKGTAWSWLPFALGIPLLPVYGWYGATGTLPAVFLVLVPVAALEGAALAIANALADTDRDEAAGVGSIARTLGRPRAAALVLVLQLVVAAVAVAVAVTTAAPLGWVAAVVAAAAVPVAGAAAGLAGADRGPGARAAAWEVQAIGAGVLAVAWLGALGAATLDATA